MVSGRNFKKVALLSGLLTFPIHGYAGDAWNILDPAVAEISRETSANLFEGASSLFRGVAESERQNRRSPERLLEAADRLDVSAKLFGTLAQSEFATGKFPFADLKSGQQLYEWLSLASDSRVVASSDEVTAADLLLAAAVEAQSLSRLLRDILAESNYPNPQGTKTVIDRYARFLSVGTVAAEGFALMKG